MSKKQTDHSKQKSLSYTIANALDLFIPQINSLKVALPGVMKPLGESYGTISKKIKHLIDTKAIKKKETNNKIMFQLAETDSIIFEKYRGEQIAAALALRNVPMTFLVALVSQFDAYMGNILRSIFILKPEMLNASQRQLSYADLLTLENLDVAREQLIEKEVESVLRSSHADQFAWLETKVGIPLRKDLSIWPNFIELTERRNLFVHCDGVVSQQYLQVCKEHSAKSDGTIKCGDVLDVDPRYFALAYSCIFELGVKLGHVLWRKLQPDALETADDHLNSLAFDLLVDSRYHLANTLLEFACKVLKKHSSDIARRVFIVNHTIALKNLKDKRYIELIEKEDWSACREDFSLAVAVLKDDYELAARIMRRIGKNGRPSDIEYRIWPLFKEFRKSKQFKKAYKQVFHKKFLLEEEMPEKTPGDKNREQSSRGYK